MSADVLTPRRERSLQLLDAARMLGGKIGPFAEIIRKLIQYDTRSRARFRLSLSGFSSGLVDQ